MYNNNSILPCVTIISIGLSLNLKRSSQYEHTIVIMIVTISSMNGYIRDPGKYGVNKVHHHHYHHHHYPGLTIWKYIVL
jgi:hypothetical protein